jgi:hypothetical protein
MFNTNEFGEKIDQLPMQFRVGDYASMIKDPRMAGPFIKSFTIMSRV